MKKAYWIDGRLLTERDLHDIRVQLEGFKSVTAIAYWIDGRLLTERDLHDIRVQLEGLKSVTAISDEMRDVNRN